MKSVRHLRLVAACALLAIVGCSGPPEKKLYGKWIGTPNVRQDVEKAVDSAAPQGQKVNSVAKGIAGFLGQKFAEATMSVELDFQEGGRVFFRGNTDLIGLPPNSDGTWSVTEAGKNEMNITFGTDKKQFTGKVLFRDKNEFTLKFDQPVTSTPPPPPSPPKVEPKDQSKDGEKDQPKAAPKEAPKQEPKQIESIVFKRKTE
jgi:hypothetical protein